jgi:phage terminase large subunit-like protein
MTEQPAVDRMAFRREQIILEDGRPFGEAMDDWQAEDFAALDDPAHQHAYLERPRGHSKTGDLGTEAVTELMLGRPGSQLFCAAADQGQAALLLEDVVDKFERNERLRPLVRVTRNEVTVLATGSRLRVMSSDAPSAYGLRPDWIATDELAEWRNRALWDSLWTATGKRPRCRMRVISTPGWDTTSIAWEVRAIAQRESNWYFSSRGQCASWVGADWVAQQERTLPRHTFERLILGRWVEGAGAYLTRAEVDGVFSGHSGGPVEKAALGLDLGLTDDAGAAARVELRADGTVVVAGLVTYEPRPGARVDLQLVEEQVGAWARAAHIPVVVDPWQAALMAQRLRAEGVEVIEYTFTAGSRQKLFGTLLELIRTGRLRAQPHEALRKELLGLEVQETATGWRVDHRVGRHDDHVVAVALAASAVATAPVYTPARLW